MSLTQEDLNQIKQMFIEFGDKIEERLDKKIDERFEEFSIRIENKLTVRFAEFEARMDIRFEAIESRIGSLESEVNNLKLRIDCVESCLISLEKKVDAIQTSIYEEVCPLISAENAKTYDRLKDLIVQHVKSSYAHTNKEYTEMILSESSEEYKEGVMRRIRARLRARDARERKIAGIRSVGLRK